MANPTFNRNLKNYKQYGSGNMYISELAADGSITTWTQVDYFQSTTITQEVEEMSDIDDGGKKVIFSETVTSVTVAGKFLTRDEEIRQLFLNTSTQGVKDRLFALVWVGAKMDDSGTAKREVWVFSKGRFSQAFTYGGGTNEAKFDYKYTAFVNDTGADQSIALPTGIASFTGMITGTSVTVGDEEFFHTSDIA